MRFRPLTYSLLLHLFIIVLLFVSLPFSWRVTTEETPIIVEFVDVKSSRNLNSKSNPQARKIEKSWVNQKVAKTPKQVTKNKPMAKPVPAKPTQNEKPQAKDKAKNSNEKPAIVPLKNKVQPVKKPLAPPKKEVSKAKTENISANKKTEIKNKPQPVAQGKVLKNLDVSKTKKDIEPPKKKTLDEELASLDRELDGVSNIDKFDSEQPLSITELDAIKMQIEQHWNVPAAAKDAHNLVVVIYLKLRQDGTVEIAKAQGGNKSHQFYDIAADSATRAVYKASPLQNLPKQKYKSWQEIELTFDPSNILY